MLTIFNNSDIVNIIYKLYIGIKIRSFSMIEKEIMQTALRIR